MTTHRLRAVLLVVAAVGLLVSATGADVAASSHPGAAAQPSVAAANQKHKKTVRQVALGVSMDNATGKADTNWASVLGVKNQSGRYPALWSIWRVWNGPSSRFPTATNPTFMANLKLNHIVPVIVWQPTNPTAANPGGPSDPGRLQNVVDGTFDQYITTFANAAKAYGSTVVLRFAQEMNGPWNPWGVGHFDNTGPIYIQAWKHVRKIFQTVGATNVKFLWSPYQPCGPGIGCVPYSTVFPGDKFVDYIGYSSFNWFTATTPGQSIRPWTDMVTVMKTGYKKLVALSHKPIIVAELACNRNPKGGDQAAWITKGYPAAYTLYPQIVAILYFDIDMTKINPEDPSQPNWTLTAPSWSAYKTLLTQKHFRGVIG